jgi:hypothetical protein
LVITDCDDDVDAAGERDEDEEFDDELKDISKSPAIMRKSK